MRRFYETYPYPRPLDSLEQYRRLWQDPMRRRADFERLFWYDQVVFDTSRKRGSSLDSN